MFDEIQQQFIDQKEALNKTINEVDDKVCTLSGLLDIQELQVTKTQETIRSVKVKQDALEANMKRLLDQAHESRISLVEQTRVSLEEQSDRIN